MLMRLDRGGAAQVIEEASSAMPPREVAERVVAPALHRIGKGWQEGQASLAHVYMAGKICYGLLLDILPHDDGGRPLAPRMAIASLEDHHSLGLRIVLSMLRATGFEVSDYGRQDVRSLAALVRADRVEVLFISTLMLRSALRVKDLRRELSKTGCSPRIVVGGAPFLLDPLLHRKVGADDMGRDASEAVRIAMGHRREA